MFYYYSPIVLLTYIQYSLISAMNIYFNLSFALCTSHYIA